MFTTSKNLVLAIGVAALAVAANARAEKYGFGTVPTAAQLSAAIDSWPADGRDLPPGRGTFAEGKKIYGDACVACHGAKLQGVAGAGDTLIGGRGSLTGGKPLKTVESYWPYATTVFDYVKRAMPFNAPGSLSDSQAYAVTAYILGEARIIPQEEVIDAGTLPKVKMPNRHGFITHDPRPDVENY